MMAVPSNTLHTPRSGAGPRLRLAAVGLMLLASGCSALRPAAEPDTSFYALLGGPSAAPVTAPQAGPRAGPTLIVNPPHAATGFDSPRIIYMREPHKMEYYARSEWVDTPARMLAPLIVTAIEGARGFDAVILTPSAAAGDLRLDLEILQLVQDFRSRPASVRFTLRAYVMDNTTRRVLAWREFEQSVPTGSEDAYGGVAAANRAVQAVLADLAGFCAEVARNWQAAAGRPRPVGEKGVR